MFRILRTNSTHPDFITLVKLLDADLAVLDGEEHNFYAPFNTIANIQHCMVLYHDEIAIGCGALKHFDNATAEIKRMFVLPTHRGKGVASQILHSLEQWAVELGFNCCILETGKRMPEAIALYKKNGYISIENYGQYAGIENSICFKKTLT